MNAVYSKALEAMLTPGLDLSAGTVKAQLLSAGYVYNAAHDFLDDVGAGFRIGSAVTLAGKTFTSGQFDATNPVFSAVPAGTDIAAVILYLDAGSDATRRLLAFIDTKADTTALLITPNGGNITLTWPTPIFTI